MKDTYIGNAYFDASASAFIMPSLLNRLRLHHNTCTDSDTGTGTGTASGLAHDADRDKCKGKCNPDVSNVFVLSSSAPAAWNSSSTSINTDSTPNINSSTTATSDVEIERANKHNNPGNILMNTHVAAGPGWLQRSDYFQNNHNNKKNHCDGNYSCGNGNNNGGNGNVEDNADNREMLKVYIHICIRV